jgi:hypothetical protein
VHAKYVGTPLAVGPVDENLPIKTAGSEERRIENLGTVGGGRGRIKHSEFLCASGEMTSSQFLQFLKDTLGKCADCIVDGGITYVCMDWRHARELLEAGATAYDELKNICVWTKTTPGQGSFYRSQHELVFVYKRASRHTSTHLNLDSMGAAAAMFGATRAPTRFVLAGWMI